MELNDAVRRSPLRLPLGLRGTSGGVTPLPPPPIEAIRLPWPLARKAEVPSKEPFHGPPPPCSSCCRLGWMTAEEYPEKDPHLLS